MKERGLPHHIPSWTGVDVKLYLGTAFREVWIGAGRGGWALSIELVGVLSGERWTNDGAVSGTPSDTFQPPIVCQSSDSGRVNPEFPQSLISDGSVVDVGGLECVENLRGHITCLPKILRKMSSS